MNRTILLIRPIAAAGLMLLATAPAFAQTQAPETATADQATTTADQTATDTTADRNAIDTVPDREVERREEDRDLPWGLLGLLGLAGLMKRKEETRVVHNHSTRPDDTRR